MRGRVCVACFFFPGCLFRSQADPLVSRNSTPQASEITLQAEGGGGMVGDAFFMYLKGSPDYKMYMKHVGGLKMGQSNPFRRLTRHPTKTPTIGFSEIS